jgi:hypothetical protein
VSRDSFDHARANARPGCPKCKGTGEYQYSTHGTPHFTVCDLCCRHDRGWWKLEHHYGEKNGLWCCSAGCGLTVEAPPAPHCEHGRSILEPCPACK